MTDESKNMEEAANQPYQPPEASPSQPAPMVEPEAPASAWQPEPYTPPTAEPPAGMDASSFSGAEPVQPPPAPPLQGEVVTPPPTQTGGNYTPPPAGTPPGAPVKKSGTNWWVIVLVILLLLCCCCGVLALGVYWFGDTIWQQYIQDYMRLVTSLAV